MATNSFVLVVLSSEQREARAPELAGFERPGLSIVFEESPEAALDLIAKTPPAVVLVGMMVGDMEGLEFLALLLKRSPGFQGKVVVMPDKGDPFPPMLQGRDPVTKKSTTTAIDMAGIAALVADLAVTLDPPPVHAKDVAKAVAKAAEPMVAAAGNGARADASPAFEPAITPSSRRPIGLAIGALGLVVVIVIVLAKAVGSGPSAVASARPPTSSPSVEPKSTGASSPESRPSATAAEATAKEPEARPDPLEQLTTLPLTFAKGSADFEVTNTAKLEEIVDGIKRTLGTSRLEVGGHTSSDGPDRLNEDLSLRRAVNVKRYLVGKGIPDAQTVLKDYKMSAAAPSSTDESNRRVTVRVLR
jgi:outer membrane protein OmpA-like peptidoglycan-associated protein/CheY-like chemotaxis protein